MCAAQGGTLVHARGNYSASLLSSQRVCDVISCMKPIVELQRLASPVPRPQALYVDGPTLWVSSRATKKLYTIDRAAWKVTSEWNAPDASTPWGITKAGNNFFAVCGIDLDTVDDRTIRRFVPGQGFDPQFRWMCPNLMGSHLSHTGEALVLSQWYDKKLFVFDATGQPTCVYNVPHCIVGQCFAHGVFYLATTDAEETDEYWLQRLDPATGRTEPVARIGFSARALAFDGENFWTNHRDRDQIVSFKLA